ncbi:DUF1450 domain-containing protein [Proteiniclasticum sp. SCR006]|uniref:DUF1450 domain-containing protein n=1 Tax=Proteiniclasticum aestuarii TaxID=2817862 RepID=A0A939HBU1_9CLOT|nr:DUF1450 domain-containing protein [Proteiniclasticum aestuarii]MBO1264443.1 DUF1450 domain-containing protein [Proteiniclasticum aestuarii]
MIKVCEHCSNINIEQLKKAVGEDIVQVGCIDKCAAYETEAYGYVDEELVVENNTEEWIKKVSNNIRR